MRRIAIFERRDPLVDERGEEKFARGASARAQQLQHLRGVVRIEMGEDRIQNDEVERFERRKAARLGERDAGRIVHLVAHVPPKEAKPGIVGGEVLVQKVDGPLVDIDARVRFDRDAAVDDGLREAHPAPDVQYVDLSEVRDPDSPRDDTEHLLAGVFGPGREHVRSVALKFVGDVQVQASPRSGERRTAACLSSSGAG
jgi:hypothetical protein